MIKIYKDLLDLIEVFVELEWLSNLMPFNWVQETLTILVRMNVRLPPALCIFFFKRVNVDYKNVIQADIRHNFKTTLFIATYVGNFKWSFANLISISLKPLINFNLIIS